MRERGHRDENTSTEEDGGILGAAQAQADLQNKLNMGERICALLQFLLEQCAMEMGL